MNFGLLCRWLKRSECHMTVALYSSRSIGARLLRSITGSCLVVVALLSSATTQQKITGPATPVPATYFGLHVHFPNSGNPYSWPVDYVGFGSYRTWDDSEGVTWAYVQRNPPLRIRSIYRRGGEVTVVTEEAHGMIPNRQNTAEITGVADPSFNGTFVVSPQYGKPTSTFSYRQPGQDASSSSGTVVSYDWTNLDKVIELAQAFGKQVLYTFGNTPYWATREKPKEVQIASLGRDGQVVHVTTVAPHPYAANSSAHPLAVIRNVPEATFNGAYSLKSVDGPTTFTYTDASHHTGDENARGGTVQVYDSGGGINLGAVPNTRVCLAPASSMEPDPEKWRDFVAHVVKRYCGCDGSSHPTARLHYYELWNEPNLTGEGGRGSTFFVPVGGRSYADSAAAMVPVARIAYQTIKSIDPTAVVVSPAATGDQSTTGIKWVDAFLSLGGAGALSTCSHTTSTWDARHPSTWPGSFANSRMCCKATRSINPSGIPKSAGEELPASTNSRQQVIWPEL